MPDDLLSPLDHSPVPPLAPAAAVRARGDQRRRRIRAALAGTGAVAVAVAAVTGVALGDPDGGRDRVRPAPLASSAPVTQEDPVYAALLDPQDVEAVLGGGWDLDRRSESTSSPVLEGCPSTAAPLVGPSSGRFLTDGPRVTGQHLEVLPDDAAADERFRTVLATVRVCRETSPAYRLFESGAQVSTRVMGEQLEGGRTRPFSLERVGRVVVVTMLDGTDDAFPRLAEAAADEVRAVFPQAAPRRPSSAAPSPAPQDVTPLLLDRADVEAAEFGTWALGDQTGADRTLLDPCTGGTDYPRDADRVARAVTGWSSTREAGGTSLTQTVARYSSPAAARDAAEGYERAVRTCPVEQGGEELEGSTRTHRVVEEYSELAGVRTLYVRTEGSCPQCSTAHGYVVVQQVGDVVSVLAVAHSEDGDPGVDVVRPFAEAAARDLAP